MQKFKLSESGDRGWFVGSFDRAVWKTEDFELSYTFNPKGDVSPRHYHKIARELSLITQGHVVVNGEHFYTGDIFIFEPGEENEAYYEEDTYTVCLKAPGAPNDKYYV